MEPRGRARPLELPNPHHRGRQARFPRSRRATSAMSAFNGFNPVMSMAPISEPPRPAMRRKSSAQNLLASFKSNPNAASGGGAPPSSFPAAPPSLPYPSSVPTPTTATMSREWDVQSLHSDGVSSSAGTSLQTNGSLPPGTSVDVLRELVKKRIITLTYLRNVHEGCVSISVRLRDSRRPGSVPTPDEVTGSTRS